MNKIFLSIQLQHIVGHVVKRDTEENCRSAKIVSNSNRRIYHNLLKDSGGNEEKFFVFPVSLD
jgi:hypothetical protein